MKKRKKVLLGIIISIVLAVTAIVLSISSTQAFFTHSDVSTRKNNYNTGILSITALSKSDTISLDGAIPITDEVGAAQDPYIFTVKNNGNVDYEFDVQLLATGANTFDPQYIKLKIDSGEVTTLSALTNSKIKTGLTLGAQQTMDISIRIWLASNTPNTQIGKTFTSQLVINGIAISPTSNYGVSAATYITNLYNSAAKTVVTNNNIDYNYATSVGLMNDRLGGTTKDLNAGNIRYYGANPNNYIYFNCSDYTNPTLQTCEKWRIIGVFDNMLKIVKEESIGNMAWDTNGSNNWSNASLNTYLNSGYYWETTIKNGETQNKIATINWNLGSSHDLDNDFPNNFYVSERMYSNYSGVATWIGKVGLIYISDYGYAANFSYCNSEMISYDSSGCNENNWIFYQENDTSTLLLTLNSIYNNSNNVIHIDTDEGFLAYYNTSATAVAKVRPVIYLNADESIKSGAGTSANPYVLR